MRSVLASYLEVEPEQVAFAYGPQGKPKLACSDIGLEFNLSHTGDLALCAITRERSVGVDIEHLRPIDAAEQIITRFFSPREQAEFFESPLPDRPRTFFRAWTRKEALLKATGEGLASLTGSFDVPLTDFGSERMIVGVHAETGGGWTLQDLDVGPGYIAAMAVEGELAAVNLLDWKWGTSREV
jgi:4'-phosphopantetheinyl transferase